MTNKRLLTPDLSVELSKDFLSTFTNKPPLYYAFGAKSLPYEDENVVTDPTFSVTDVFEMYESMIFAKNITADDVSMMVRNVTWQSGQTYDYYDNSDRNLYDKNFYVVSEEPGDVYSIFKCIHNGRKLNVDGTFTIPTTFSQPLSTQTSPTDKFYQTADGYVWKLMTVMDRQTYEKFATSKYVPVTANTAVSNAATPGEVSFIEVLTGGSNYNAYAYGTVKESQVAGDPKIFSLQTDTSLNILTFGVNLLSGDFAIEHSAGVNKKTFFRLSNNSIWTVGGNEVESKTYSLISNSTVRVLLDSTINLPTTVTEIFQTTNNLPGGAYSARATILDIRRDLTPNLSANTDFYKNSSFYIRSGRGAGQLKNITEYIVTGNERRILIDQAFDIIPDSTSRFEIGPRIFITGDGTGSANVDSATAIATVNPSGNTISEIEVVDPGKNYTYANIEIQSNTGFVDVETGLAINASGATTNSIIAPSKGHGADILYELNANAVGVSITLAGSEGGKLPVQNDYRTLGILKDPLLANTEFTIADSALLFTDGDIITQPATGSSAEVSFREGNNLRVRNIRGFFETGESIFSSDLSVESVINTIDRTSTVLDQRVLFTVEVTNLGPQGTGFLEDELVTQEITNATGYVYSIDTNRIDLVKVRNIWNVSDDASGSVAEMIGTVSGAVAKITGKKEGDIVPNTGKIVYLENMEAIERDTEQTERLKVVLTF